MSSPDSKGSSSKQLPPLLPLDQARAIRGICLRAAWHAANKHIGYEEDARSDLNALQQLIESMAETCGSELAGMIEHLALSAAWKVVHSLNEEADDAEAASSEFSNSIISIEALVGEAAPLVGEMASAAAQHAAHRRFTGDECEEARAALVSLIRIFHQLSTWRRAKWVGVNLGGWLLLEYGPAAPLFQNQGAEGNGEWAFSEDLRAHGLAEEVWL